MDRISKQVDDFMVNAVPCVLECVANDGNGQSTKVALRIDIGDRHPIRDWKNVCYLEDTVANIQVKSNIGHTTPERVLMRPLMSEYICSPLLSTLNWYNDRRLEDSSCWFGKKIRLLPNDVNIYRYETPRKVRVGI